MQEAEQQELRRLYWHSKTRVNELARRFSVKPAELQALAGPLDVGPCQRCGDELVATSRSQRDHWKGGFWSFQRFTDEKFDYEKPLCEKCRRALRERAEHLRESAAVAIWERRRDLLDEEHEEFEPATALALEYLIRDARRQLITVGLGAGLDARWLVQLVAFDIPAARWEPGIAQETLFAVERDSLVECLEKAREYVGAHAAHEEAARKLAELEGEEGEQELVEEGYVARTILENPELYDLSVCVPISDDDSAPGHGCYHKPEPIRDDDTVWSFCGEQMMDLRDLSSRAWTTQVEWAAVERGFTACSACTAAGASWHPEQPAEDR